MILGLVNHFSTRWLVWRIATDRVQVGVAQSHAAGRWTDLKEADVDRLFVTDRNRRETFQRYLTIGHAGLALEFEGEWLAYGWLATPASGPPDHVPRSARGRFWIHYCRTAAAHQGAGLYQQTIARLVREAGARADGRTQVWIDTREDNVAARRGIERVGFCPDGLITILRIPKSRLRMSHWRRRAIHPT